MLAYIYTKMTKPESSSDKQRDTAVLMLAASIFEQTKQKQKKMRITLSKCFLHQTQYLFNPLLLLKGCRNFQMHSMVKSSLFHLHLSQLKVLMR